MDTIKTGIGLALVGLVIWAFIGALQFFASLVPAQHTNPNPTAVVVHQNQSLPTLMPTLAPHATAQPTAEVVAQTATVTVSGVSAKLALPLDAEPVILTVIGRNATDYNLFDVVYQDPNSPMAKYFGTVLGQNNIDWPDLVNDSYWADANEDGIIQGLVDFPYPAKP